MDTTNIDSLVYSLAVVPITCTNCQGEIDIGDDCYIDRSLGLEEKHAKVYCASCVEND